MCDFDPLYHGEDGYIIRCASCNHYQLAFGTFCITLEEENFILLQAVAADACATIQQTEACHAKRFSLGTPFPEVSIVLTKNELLRFRAMLDTADSEAKALSMLKMFTNHAR